jgi:EpsI family protein
MRKAVNADLAVARTARVFEWPLGAIAVAFYCVALAFDTPELRELSRLWQSSSPEAHGWAIVLLVPVMLWIGMRRLGPRAPDEAGHSKIIPLMGLFATALISALAHAAAIDAFALLNVPAGVFFALWLLHGPRAARAAAAPLAYFLFALPLWELLLPLLQWMTIKASVPLLHLMGVATTVHAPYVTVPAGVFEIETSCSGLHFLVAALATSALIAFFDGLPWKKATLLIGSALLVALVTNWLRVAFIIFIGNRTAMTAPLVKDHSTFGWWLFAFALIPIMLLARRLARTPRPRPDVPHERAKLSGVPVACGALLLALGPVWVLAVDLRAESPEQVRWPASLPQGWLSSQSAPPDWKPQYPGALAERLTAFTSAAASVDLYVAVYGLQGPGHKLIGYDSSITGSGWEVLRDARITVPASHASVREMEISDRSGHRRLLWMWYEVRGERAPSATDVKLRQSLSAFGLSSRSAVVALSARCAADCTSAREMIVSAHSRLE